MTFQWTVFIAKFGDIKNDWSDPREGKSRPPNMLSNHSSFILHFCHIKSTIKCISAKPKCAATARRKTVFIPCTITVKRAMLKHATEQSYQIVELTNKRMNSEDGSRVQLQYFCCFWLFDMSWHTNKLMPLWHHWAFWNMGLQNDPIGL